MLLHRGRSADGVATPEIRAEGQSLRVSFAPGLLSQNPLTQADLDQEQAWLKGIGLKLSVS